MSGVAPGTSQSLFFTVLFTEPGVWVGTACGGALDGAGNETTDCDDAVVSAPASTPITAYGAVTSHVGVLAVAIKMLEGREATRQPPPQVPVQVPIGVTNPW